MTSIHRCIACGTHGASTLSKERSVLQLVVFQGGPQFGYLWLGAVASLVGPILALVIGGSAALLGAAGSSQVPVLRRNLKQPLR